MTAKARRWQSAFSGSLADRIESGEIHVYEIDMVYGFHDTSDDSGSYVIHRDRTYDDSVTLKFIRVSP